MWIHADPDPQPWIEAPGPQTSGAGAAQNSGGSATLNYICLAQWTNFVASTVHIEL